MSPPHPNAAIQTTLESLSAFLKVAIIDPSQIIPKNPQPTRRTRCTRRRYMSYKALLDMNCRRVRQVRRVDLGSDPRGLSLPKIPSVNRFHPCFTNRRPLAASNILEKGSLVLGTAGSSIFCYF